MHTLKYTCKGSKVKTVDLGLRIYIYSVVYTVIGLHITQQARDVGPAQCR